MTGDNQVSLQQRLESYRNGDTVFIFGADGVLFPRGTTDPRGSFTNENFREVLADQESAHPGSVTILMGREFKDEAVGPKGFLSDGGLPEGLKAMTVMPSNGSRLYKGDEFSEIPAPEIEAPARNRAHAVGKQLEEMQKNIADIPFATEVLKPVFSQLLFRQLSDGYNINFSKVDGPARDEVIHAVKKLLVRTRDEFETEPVDVVRDFYKDIEDAVLGHKKVMPASDARPNDQHKLTLKEDSGTLLELRSSVVDMGKNAAHWVKSGMLAEAGQRVVYISDNVHFSDAKGDKGRHRLVVEALRDAAQEAGVEVEFWQSLDTKETPKNPIAASDPLKPLCTFIFAGPDDLGRFLDAVTDPESNLASIAQSLRNGVKGITYAGPNDPAPLAGVNLDEYTHG